MMKNSIALPQANPIAPPHPEQRKYDRLCDGRSVFGGDAIDFRGRCDRSYSGSSPIVCCAA